MALFTRTAKLDLGAHGVRCARAMAVHHAVGISCQSRYPSRVNITAQGLSTPDPSLSPTHLSIRRGRTTTTHYIHHQVSLMVSRNTTLVPSLGLRIGRASLLGRPQRWHAKWVCATPKDKDKDKDTGRACIFDTDVISQTIVYNVYMFTGISILPAYLSCPILHQWRGHTRNSKASYSLWKLTCPVT